MLRPLVDVARADLERYVEMRAISYVEDDSNDDASLLRNAVRRGNAPEAVQHYEAALALNGELISAHLGLGRAWAAQW